MTVSNEHGHADEAGNVFLNTEQGPVKVGQFVAGTPQEGLDFFRRKYDELVTDAQLALARLRDSKAAPDSAASVLDRLAAVVERPAVLGDVSVFPRLRAEIEEQLEKRKAEVSQAKAEAKAAALAAREDIVRKAEELVSSTQWKPTGEKFKELLDEWKKLPGADRGKEQELWKRFSAARSAFDKARRAYFATLESTRAEGVAAKRALIAKAQVLADSTDWQASANAFKGLMSQWKELPRVARDQEERLWKEFKALQDRFFDARSAALTERDGELSGNLEVKLGLLERAEALLPVVDVDKAKAALRDIQAAWEKAGHVPRAEKERVERRLKAVEDAVRKVQEDLWHRTKPEVIDRAHGLIASFQAQIDKLEQQLAAAAAAGKQAEADRLAAQKAAAQELLDAARSGADKLG